MSLLKTNQLFGNTNAQTYQVLARSPNYLPDSTFLDLRNLAADAPDNLASANQYFVELNVSQPVVFDAFFKVIFPTKQILYKNHGPIFSSSLNYLGYTNKINANYHTDVGSTSTASAGFHIIYSLEITQ